MKFTCWIISYILFSVTVFAQAPFLRVGSTFPDMVITNISNAPVKEIYINKDKSSKLYILNFWGTWCSPCIPEMDALAKLQKANNNSIQIIAISDDSQERKQKYLAKKPSGIWLATDTAYTLYDMLGLASVGNCVIVNARKQILAVLKTDSINQQVVNKLLSGISVTSNAYLKEPLISTKEDAFGVDSLLQQSFSIRGYMTGRQSMGKRYKDGAFKDRRISWFNVPVTTIYREAYGIYAHNQELYDSSVSKKDINDFNDKHKLYCVDLTVAPGQKGSLNVLLQTALNNNLPVKVRQEYRELPVYVLKLRTDTVVNLMVSKATSSSYSFSGRGYKGEKITMEEFANHYLTNELGLPVVNETALAKAYDIETKIDLRTAENIRNSIGLLGLTIEKAERKMPVIVYYR